MALTDANLAFGPTERKGGLHGAPRWLQTAGSVAQGVGRLLRNFGKNATGFWVFGFEILGVWHEMLSVWHRKLGVWHDLLGVWHDLLGV